MTDLLDKIKTQIGYARKEIAAGTADEAIPHLDKAAQFLDRLLVDGEVDDPADAGNPAAPLSDDMAEAAQQLLVRYGFAEGSSPSGAEIVAASPDKGRLAAVVGLLGQPGAIPGADYSLFQEGYEPSSPPDEESGLQSWAPKTEWAASGSYWKHVNAGGN